VGDQFDAKLARFVDAQDPVFSRVRKELEAGRKETHWMWYVFPQLVGLGSSPMSESFGLGSTEEARRYLAHEVLGPRLRECTRLVLRSGAQQIGAVFGYPDDLKFRSCMTLFALAAPDEECFRAALEHFFRGAPDPRTVERLARDEDQPRPE